MKRVLRLQHGDHDLVDPYMIVSFAGKKLKTKVMYKTYTPEWDQELNIGVQMPSMCEQLMLRLMDKWVEMWGAVTYSQVIWALLLMVRESDVCYQWYFDTSSKFYLVQLFSVTLFSIRRCWWVSATNLDGRVLLPTLTLGSFLSINLNKIILIKTQSSLFNAFFKLIFPVNIINKAVYPFNLRVNGMLKLSYFHGR